MRRRRASRILGVPAASPARTVNKKYRELARAAHPDRPGGSEDLFKELSAARDALLASDSDSDSGGSAQGGDDRGRDYFHRIAVSLDEMYTGRVSFIGMKRTVIAADGCTTATVRETLRVEVPRGASGGDQIVFKGKGTSALRVFRLARVFKVAKSWYVTSVGCKVGRALSCR